MKFAWKNIDLKIFEEHIIEELMQLTCCQSEEDAFQMKTISEEVDNALIKDTNNLDVITVVEIFASKIRCLEYEANEKNIVDMKIISSATMKQRRYEEGKVADEHAMFIKLKKLQE
jgi:hypothetical protein